MTASRSPLAVRLAVYIRNQCNAVIKYHFARSAHFNDTGEGWLLAAIAPTAHTIMDVGANVGDWTATARAMAPDHAQFVAVEPGKAAYDRLLARLGNQPNIRTFRTALSNAPGQAKFYEQPDASETSSLAPDFAIGSTTNETILLSTVDLLARELSWSTIDLLKIDTEGYDLRVLEGAQDLLAGNNIGVIQFEYNDPWRYAGSTLHGAYTLLEGAGYKLFMLRYDGIYEFNYGRYGDFFGYSNFVAAAPSALHLLNPHFKGKI